ncbi:LysR family transcriptional regulator [Sphingobium subterraneum]|uniref:DNA-binding transcriptional LysR family regulator n=1 Tax=Sphingobium subterraneum TaxID=627688 RepID=A0A841J1X6_9SPHN|nr:LysR family transcriptional regulator [Sphingobium subterraneum]MBB6124660.1 DNA-binding transcriptional LysR family regulator [Sphingobium subterraneum]
MMDPNYELFAEIVAQGSLSAAGRSVGLSPAMVSKRLVQLEQRLGTRLIHRTTRKIALSPQGKRLYGDITQILNALRDAEQKVRGKRGVPAGLLRVTAPTSFGRMHLAPHLVEFLRRFPSIELRLDLSDEITDLMSDPFDLAIRISAEPGPGLVHHRLAGSPRVICAAPAYLAEHGRPDGIAELVWHRLLAADGQLPWRLRGPDGVRMVEGTSVVATNSSEVVRELTLAGGGIALRSLWDVGAELGSGLLERLLPDHEGSSDVGIYAVHPPIIGAPGAVTAFIDYVTELYSVAPPWAG